MFDRFSDSAKQAMNLARQEALRGGSAAMRPQHVLLGLLGVPECAAVRALDSLGVDREALRERARAALPSEEGGDHARLPFTATAKLLLEHAMEGATRLGHEALDTGHLLLGYARLDAPSVPLGVDHEALLDTLRAQSREDGSAEARRHPQDAREHLRRAAEACDRARETLAREGRAPLADRARALVREIRSLGEDVTRDSGGQS